jgi:hypothetical protein
MAMGESWSDVEVEAVVSDYLHMLMLEQSGQRYSKTEHRNQLQSKLDGRSDGSIELKHQNISAILLEIGCPWIVGYKPRKNYQKALYERVLNRLESDRKIDQIIGAAIAQPAAVPLLSDYESLIVKAPMADKVAEPTGEYLAKERRGLHRDYLAEEFRNRSLGSAGEEFVLLYERHRLAQVGEGKLSKKVEHVSATKGDGLGFDILSYELDGTEKYIEVKTTASGKEAPFFVTRNELSFSKEEPNRFNLYRLFEFRNKPRMFTLTGPITKHCLLDPVSYVAKFS